MSEQDEKSTAAQVLRTAAADLLRQADLLEQKAVTAETVAAPKPAQPEPLGPPATEDEAAVRLIVLDAATQGRDRGELAQALAESHPSIDAAPLIDRFYGSSTG